MVKYTGQAFLSPWNWVNCVLSDERMSDAIVAPHGNFNYGKKKSVFFLFLY